MSDIIKDLANNNYVIYGLAALLGVLIIIFIILLVSGKKGKKPKKVENNNPDGEIIISQGTDNIDFDHGEYVKETTAEFELAPITEVKPTPDSYVPEVNVEESPARGIDSSAVENAPLADFNFDDLSKSISAELDRLKEEEEHPSEPTSAIPVVNPDANVDLGNTLKMRLEDAFKEEPQETTPVQTTNISNIEFNVDKKINTPAQEVIAPSSVEEEPTFMTEPTPVVNSNPYVSPVSAVNPAPTLNSVVEPVQTPSVQETPVVNNNPEPVIKEDNVPLFARFNQETYDISKKD